MKYWGFLAAKVAVAAVLLRYVWTGITMLLPAPSPFLYISPAFGHDLPWTLAACLFFVLCCGVGYLIVLDQRYRCRVCLRRLRMPVETGSWGQMLQFGRPRIEYICTFGHGTLKVPEVQIDGMAMPDWKSNDDMWKELMDAEESKR